MRRPRPRRRAGDRRGRLLRRLPDHRAAARRDPHRGPGAQARPGWGYRYEKFHRTAQAWAIVGVAALARRSNGQVAEARIGLTNMGPVPVRATAAEAAAAGAEATSDALSAAAASADEGTRATGRPARRARLPASPGAGPDRPGTGSGGRSLTDGARALIHRPGPRGPGVGCAARRREGGALHAGRHPRLGRRRRDQRQDQGQGRPDLHDLRGTAKFTERDEDAGVVTLEASGKETRGAGTASASVRSTLRTGAARPT